MRLFHKTICLLVVFFQVLSFIGFAQDPQYTIPNSQTYKRLLKSNFEGFRIVKNALYSYNYLPVTNHFKSYEQELLLMNHRLYVFLNASGIIYESQENAQNQDSLYFKRIDNTEHTGYNIDCIPFTYENKLYNIGGYGFWRCNGQLRIFDYKMKEWNIIPLNQEIPVSKYVNQPLVWQNIPNNEITTLAYMEGNEAVITNNQSPTHRVDSVLSLNLKTKSWQLKGALNPELSKILYNTKFLANLDSGLLVDNVGKIQYWNLVSNKIYKLKNTSTNQLLLIAHLITNLTWKEGNQLIIGNLANQSIIDSVIINQKDFELTEQLIFLPPSQKTKYLIVFFLVLIIAVILVFRKLQSKFTKNKLSTLNTVLPTQTPSELNSSYPKPQLFSITEIDLLRLIIKNVREHKRVTNVDEVNRVLGVGNKSLDMQKRKRSDVIKNINTRYALATNRETVVLINRMKSEIDGRLYEFYIPEEELKNVTTYLE